MILHFVEDDKFTDEGFSQFEEAAPGNNIAISIGKPANFRYIKQTKVCVFSQWQMLTPRFLHLLSSSNVLVFHSLSRDNLRLLRFCNLFGFGGIRLWIGWGYDYYDLASAKEFQAYEPATQKLWSKLLDSERKPYRRLKAVFRTALGMLSPSKISTINTLDYFAPVIHEDYELVRKSVKQLKPKYVRWNYGSAVKDLADFPLTVHPRVGNILIGNSATPTNNHIEIFNMLTDLVHDDRKLIVPLSYGNPTYQKAILALGQAKLGANFFPLVDFMALPDYVKLTSTCTHVILNHRRQQAAGNINLTLMQGSRVFLNENSPLYQFYVNSGYQVNAVAEIAKSPNLLVQPLEEEKVKINRECVDRDFGPEAIRKNSRQLVELLTAES